MKLQITSIVLLAIAPLPLAPLAAPSLASAQQAGPSTRPASAPATRPAPGSPQAMSADQMLSQMLRPGPTTAPRPLQVPNDQPAIDKTSGSGAMKPQAPPVSVLREGTFVPDRVGRLTRSADGSQAEFTFESDGKALRDPPIIILPSLKLMAMENAVAGANRDFRFRVSGTVTEYKGRNYILLEKVEVIPDVAQQF
jgi:hypothetical protein